MARLLLALFCGLWLTHAPAAEPVQHPQTKGGLIDGQQLERELQRLSWEQFRAVVEAIPKLRADIEAYGPAGWQFVKAKYKTHRWRKNVERLDDAEKRRLAELVRKARNQQK